MVELYQKLKIIRPFKPGATPQDHPQKGLYVYGHGNKKHYWYWEFDTKHQCYYEFETANSVEAWRLYREIRFELSFFNVDMEEEELFVY